MKINLKELREQLSEQYIINILTSLGADKYEDKVKEIIVEQLGVAETAVTMEASFIDDLGADSLDIVELIMALEEKYDTEIADEVAEKMVTVKDVVEYIANNK